MKSIGYAFRIFFRFIFLWIVDAVSLIIASMVLPGITISGGMTGAAAAALMLGIVNLVIRPLILMLALPFGFFAIFAVGFVANAFALIIASDLLPTFEVRDFAAAFFAGIFISAVNTVIIGLTGVGDDDSFYQGVIERLAGRRKFDGAGDQSRGLVMMEIDGLSFHHLQKALEEGYMPELSQMLEREGYALSLMDCGLPSQTSACQAGIMFGDNYDIPSFRWYGKDEGKLFVSSKDAPLINERYASGEGLMRGGSSINNMLNGDAEKSILTLADLTSGSREEKRQRARDIYLLMLNPYFIMRTLVLFINEMALEVWQYRRDKANKVYPLLNRQRHFYPAVRAATTVFMRDLAAYLTIMDIVRGSPSLYITWPGYDEVAHHSGPWSRHALATLRKYDRVIAHVRDIIERKAPRPYDLIVLSDHGQSFGPTFLQRYGYTLQEFIEEKLPEGIGVAHTFGGDDGTVAVAAISGELKNIQEQGTSGRAGGALLKQVRRVTDRSMREQAPADLEKVEPVIVCGSGNIAQVYFDLFPRKITLGELNETYPGMVDAVVQHDGVGFVVAYDEEGTPIALGKGGMRNLHTGEVSGEDPLEPYGDTELRAWQVRRIADFPHAGDLIVNSTVYADGTVAAMEELIGSHGGMGGEQTDAFIFHPGDMDVPPTRNSADVFAIFNARRGESVGEPRAGRAVAAEKQGGTAEEQAAAGKQAGVSGEGTVAAGVRAGLAEVDAWSLSTLIRGVFHQAGDWAGLALRALFLDRSAYREVSREPLMTGPALLLGLVGSVIMAYVLADRLSPAAIAAGIASWLATVLGIYWAGRLLRSRADFTQAFRAVSFARVPHFLYLLALLPEVGPLARIAAMLIGFVATWMAAVEALKISRWRALVLPLLTILILAAGLIALRTLESGAMITLESLKQDLGLMPK
ncbi:MAG: phage holin family protein [Actinobacteria bacterium]|nr:phage holin family protein [Actinomycetota bacterium]